MSTISFTQLSEQFAKAAADVEELANLKIKYDYVKNLNNTLENERLEHNHKCFNLQMERLLFIQQLEEKIDKLGGEVYEHKSTNKQLVKELDDVKEKNRWLVRELEDLKEKNQHEDLKDLKKTQYNLEDEIKDLKEKNRKLVAALIDQVSNEQTSKKDVDKSRLKTKCGNHYHVNNMFGTEFQVRDTGIKIGAVFHKGLESFIVQGHCSEGYCWGFYNDNKYVSTIDNLKTIADLKRHGWMLDA